jgi:hypothetical protein
LPTFKAYLKYVPNLTLLDGVQWCKGDNTCENAKNKGKKKSNSNATIEIHSRKPRQPN